MSEEPLGNRIGEFDHLTREVVEWSDTMDSFDLDSADSESREKWDEMRRDFVQAALKLIDHIIQDPGLLRAQLEDKPRTLYRHTRRQTVYETVGDVCVQCTKTMPLQDDEVVLLYRDVVTGKYYARRYSDFYTRARFEAFEETLNKS